MESGYNILFTLQAMIGNTVIDDDMQIMPVADCNKIMQNHAMVFKSRPGKSFVAAPYFTNDQQVSSISRPITTTQKFSFIIILKNERFFQQADLQNAGQDINCTGRKIYYFNNLDAANNIDVNVANNTLPLSENALVSPADLSSVIPASFGFPVDKTKYNEIELYKILPSQPDKKLTSVFKANMPNAQFALNGYQPGLFQLRWVGNPARTENIYADNDLVKDNFFAVVEIFKDANANNNILQNKTIHYTIPFKAT